MERKYKTNAFKKLLDRLQEDSWQLELLISGFAIFGLFYAAKPILNLHRNSNFNGDVVSTTFYSIIFFSIFILIFNLLLHVILRGLWIGSLGLRYVSGDIDFDELKYTEKFTKYLKKKVGSFDAYIEKLENLCSVIFAISFLLIFYNLALFLLGIIVANFVELTKGLQSEWINKLIELPLVILFLTGTLLTFIDFITLGFLKKNKWLSKIYFPFYRVFSILTLSFLYRPLVYNFLDNKFGRKISLILVPFYILILISTSFKYQISNVIPIKSTSVSKNNIANDRSYQDTFSKDEDVFIDAFAIQSKVITEPYLKIIVPLVKQIEDPLIEFDSVLKPNKTIRGFKTGISININDKSKKVNTDSIRNLYLKTFEKYYRFKIDSTPYKTEFVIASNKNTLSFESYIGIKNLSEGKHTISFLKLKNKKSDSLTTIREVPFWYFKK